MNLLSILLIFLVTGILTRLFMMLFLPIIGHVFNPYWKKNSVICRLRGKRRLIKQKKFDYIDE